MKSFSIAIVSLMATVSLAQQNPNKMVFPNCSDVVAENGVKLLQNLMREHSRSVIDYLESSNSNEKTKELFLARSAGATQANTDLLKDLINRQCEETNKLKK